MWTLVEKQVLKLLDLIVKGWDGVEVPIDYVVEQSVHERADAIANWVATAIRPDLPVAVARAGVQRSSGLVCRHVATQSWDVADRTDSFRRERSRPSGVSSVATEVG